MAPSLAGFDDLRVTATLYSGSGQEADSKPVMVAEPVAMKTDVWMAADTAGLADRAAAGYGGSAKVVTCRLNTRLEYFARELLSVMHSARSGEFCTMRDLQTGMCGGDCA